MQPVARSARRRRDSSPGPGNQGPGGGLSRDGLARSRRRALITALAELLAGRQAVVVHALRDHGPLDDPVGVLLDARFGAAGEALLGASEDRGALCVRLAIGDLSVAVGLHTG